MTPTIGTQAGSRLAADVRLGREIDPRTGRQVGPLGVTGVDVTAGLAPEIGQLRGEALGGIRNLIGDVQGDIQTLRGLENPFVQARVQPFVAQQERAARDAARRGVSGPLAALATNPFTAQIAEQQALATAEAQDRISRGQEQIRGLLGDISGAGQQLLQQELALLGLSQDEINQVIQSQLQQTTGTVSERRGAIGSQVGTLGKIAGGIGGFISGFCWVAREVYGADNYKWLDFRLWLMTDAPCWLRKIYINHGERFAEWIKDKPRIKRLIRFMMDKVLDNG